MGSIHCIPWNATLLPLSLSLFIPTLTMCDLPFQYPYDISTVCEPSPPPPPGIVHRRSPMQPQLFDNFTHRGRFFYKCNRGDSDKCRFFKWEDGGGNDARSLPGSGRSGGGRQARDGSSAFGSLTSAGHVLGGGGNGNGNGSSNSNSNSDRVREPSQYPAMHHDQQHQQHQKGALASSSQVSSSSSTEYTPSPYKPSSIAPGGSPSKRRRADEDQQDGSLDEEATIRTDRSTQPPPPGQKVPSWTPQPRPSTTPTSKARYHAAHESLSAHPSASQAYSHSHSHSQSGLQQTPEDAILDDWDEDIEDFETFERGGPADGQGDPNSPLSNKKGGRGGGGKFVSFGGVAATPTTPPRLAPGLPVTPTSNTTSTANNRALDKWRAIREDPSDPFYERGRALLGSGGQNVGSSPSSATTGSGDTTHPLITPPRTDDASVTTAQQAPTTPAHAVRSLSEQITQFNTGIAEQLSSAAKSLETNERRLKASEQKARHHQEMEKKLRGEIDGLREKLR